MVCIGTALISDTQNSEIKEFSTTHAYKIKRQAKMKRKNGIFLGSWLVTSLPLYLKSEGVRTDHKQVNTIAT